MLIHVDVAACRAGIHAKMDETLWGTEVELVYVASGGQLKVMREQITLREAVEAFAHLSVHARISAGICVHQPIPLAIGGENHLLGWYNAEAVELMAQALPPGRAGPALP